MRFKELDQFVREEMRRANGRNYQPVMILTLFNDDGRASKERIKAELQKANPDYDISYFNDCEVFNVLTKVHPVTSYDESRKLFSILDYDTYSPEEKQKIIELCEEELQKSYYTFKNAAQKILQEEGKPLHYKEITKKVLEKNLITTSGKTPELTLLRSITEDIRINRDDSLFKKVDTGIYTINSNDMIRFFIALGPWSNWDHTLKNPPFRWGVNPSSASNVGVFNALRPGDSVYFYANKDPPTPFTDRGLFGVGRVIRKYDEERELYWPDEKLKNQVIYKHRFEIEPLKIVKTDSESLQWIDGLPFTKGLNRIANTETLQKLIENTHKKWGIRLPATHESYFEGKYLDEDDFIGEQNYLLLRHNIKQDSDWNDEFGKIYHFGKIPNYTKLLAGANVIWYDRLEGKYLILGYGKVKEIDGNLISDDLYAQMANFEKFDPPKPITEELRSKITSLPHFNNQHSILPITREIYNEIIYGKHGESPMRTFDDESLPIPRQEDLTRGYEKISDELLVPEPKVIEIVTALASGRHVLLAGPIGTGKTRLAKIIPEIFWQSVGGYYSEDHTATADWSTQDVIGGIFPKMADGKPVYEIQNGCVVETVAKNWEHKLDGGKRCYSDSQHRGTWLIIDEFNRADIDKAFGQLFTALRTRSLKIPTDRQGISYKTLKIPEDYRIIGTLNTADKHFLFQLSDALKSRFAYIEIDIPSRKDSEKEIYYAMKNAIDELGSDNYEALITLDHTNKKINKEKSDLDFYNRVYQAYHFLDLVRIFKKLGTAILKLVYQNLLVGTKITGNSKLALDNSLKSNLIPQLENLPRSAIGSINALYSDDIAKFFKDAYKNPNRQSYSEAFTKILDYLEITNTARLANEFSNGTLQVDNDSTWVPLKSAQEKKKLEFESELDQLKQSMTDLIKSIAI